MKTTEIHLTYDSAYDWAFFLRYLSARGTPGVEQIIGKTYRRHCDFDGRPAVLQLSHDSSKSQLIATIDCEERIPTDELMPRLPRMFDLDSDLAAVRRVLWADGLIGPLLRKAPGVRIPGAWSEHELLVRIIAGQQVTVKAATTIMGRIVQRLGIRKRFRDDSAMLLFPVPHELACGDLNGIGMPTKRVAALQAVARAIADGALDFKKHPVPNVSEIKQILLFLPAIGPWTVEYFALRALRDTDAWPESDLVLRRTVSEMPEACRAAGIAAWSPYRGYAAMHLWNHASRTLDNTVQPRLGEQICQQQKNTMTPSIRD